MGIKVNVADLPDASELELDEGIYILEVEEIIEDETQSGQDKIMMSHKIPGKSQKINFDNYVMDNEDGSPNVRGRVKLSAFVKALDLQKNFETITTEILQKFGPGKRFKANLAINEKGYPRINFQDIWPLDDPREALNQEFVNNETKTQKPSKEAKKAKEDTEDDAVTEVDEDSI